MEKRDLTNLYGLLPFGTNLKNVTNKTLKLGDFQFLIIFYLIKQIYKGLCIYLLYFIHLNICNCILSLISCVKSHIIVGGITKGSMDIEMGNEQ